MPSVHALYQSGKRWENGSVKDAYSACCVCGAPSGKRPKRMTVDISAGAFVHPYAVDPNNSELVEFNVGSECLKKHPELLPYVVKA